MSRVMVVSRFSKKLQAAERLYWFGTMAKWFLSNGIDQNTVLFNMVSIFAPRMFDEKS